MDSTMQDGRRMKNEMEINTQKSGEIMYIPIGLISYSFPYKIMLLQILFGGKQCACPITKKNYRISSWLLNNLKQRV